VRAGSKRWASEKSHSGAGAELVAERDLEGFELLPDLRGEGGGGEHQFAPGLPLFRDEYVKAFTPHPLAAAVGDWYARLGAARARAQGRGDRSRGRGRARRLSETPPITFQQPSASSATASLGAIDRPRRLRSSSRARAGPGLLRGESAGYYV
jgi:hypothetical protein